MGRFDYREIDAVIHSRIRLAAMSLLASVDEADFIYLREQLETTDGNLATHIAKLHEAGYVEQTKRAVAGRSNTTYRLTPRGRAAFEAYVDRLRRFLRP